MLKMKNMRTVFEVYKCDKKDLVGYQGIKCHFVFDIKFGEGFSQKYRLVGVGRVTEKPSTLTYASVISRYSVSISLTLGTLK